MTHLKIIIALSLCVASIAQAAPPVAFITTPGRSFSSVSGMTPWFTPVTPPAELPAPVALPESFQHINSAVPALQPAISNIVNTLHLNVPFGNIVNTINNNVPVSTVPEPSTGMLMLSGLGIIGSIARRRSLRRS